jgi:endonuclease YncB( thermonuclease family)
VLRLSTFAVVLLLIAGSGSAEAQRNCRKGKPCAGRLLASLYTPDGRMANEEIVRAGYALLYTYPPNVRHVERIRAAQEVARAGRHALWSTSAFDCAPAPRTRSS